MPIVDHNDLICDTSAQLARLRKAQPKAMQGFTQLAQASMAEGAIGAKHKELIALAIGITQRCSACIGYHVRALIQLGGTREELEELLTICTYMGGGPALMYAAEALKCWDAMTREAVCATVAPA